MEAAEILARFAKSREVEVTLGNGWRIRLQLPTEFDERRHALEVGDGAAAAQLWTRRLLCAAVIGWSGPTLDDVLHEGDTAPLPFAPALVAVLFDAALDAYDELVRAFHAERQVRQERREAAAKNSASVSSGN